MASRSTLQLTTSAARSLDANDALAADTNGAGVDLKGYEEALIVARVGAAAFTINGTNFLALELEESDDDSSYTDVAAADIVGGNGGSGGQFALYDDSAEDDVVTTVAYVGTKRYVRVVANFSGTVTGGIPVCALVVRGRPRHTTGQAV